MYVCIIIIHFHTLKVLFGHTVGLNPRVKISLFYFARWSRQASCDTHHIANVHPRCFGRFVFPLWNWQRKRNSQTYHEGKDSRAPQWHGHWTGVKTLRLPDRFWNLCLSICACGGGRFKCLLFMKAIPLHGWLCSFLPLNTVIYNLFVFLMYVNTRICVCAD